ncbi:MAG: dipeptidase [Verrucomicrobia bacterium]|nr:dipeptidase [Verrucomicrobiota bacterium]
MSSLSELKALYKKHEKKLFSDYCDLLRIPSISSNPKHAADVRRAGRWVFDYLQKGGFDVEMWETPNYPVVFASWLEAGPSKPTLLLYGHYDVQPEDPLEEWLSPPFEPTVRDGIMYARGAQDNKGQLIYTLYACRALLERDGKLPINLKILIEGEEESKSIGLGKIVHSKKKELAADSFIIVDWDIPNLEQPAITLGARGLLALTVELTGSRTDLHSGSHGGIVINPNHALISILAKLHDEEGKVTVPEFYDDVQMPTQEELSLLSLEIDEANYKKQFGAAMTGGENNYTPGQSSRLRPTLEINGITGGYGGPGVKTVIPAKAHAKISCRLVPGQNPKKILADLKQYLNALCPKGLEMTIVDYGAAPAVRSSPTLPQAKAVAKAYGEVFKKPCTYSLGGGSVPITAELAQVCGSPAIFMGVGLPDDDIHAPNEHFGLDRLELGFLTLARVLEILGE